MSIVYYSHNSGCCRRSVAPWITILSQHTLLTILSGLQIHFCVISWETRHNAPGHVTLSALVDRGLSLAARWTKMVTELSGFHWPVLVMMAIESHNICCCHTWSSNQPGGVGRSWLFPASSIKFLTRRSPKSRWVYWAPHEDNRIQMLSTVRSRRWKNSFVVHLTLRRLIE